MLRKKRESLAAFFAEVRNFAEADESGFLFGVDGGVHVGVEPTGSVAVVADPEFEPEIVAEGNGSVKGAVIADLPRKKSGHESDGDEESGARPEFAVLRDSRVRCL